VKGGLYGRQVGNLCIVCRIPTLLSMCMDFVFGTHYSENIIYSKFKIKRSVLCVVFCFVLSARWKFYIYTFLLQILCTVEFILLQILLMNSFYESHYFAFEESLEAKVFHSVRRF